MPSTRTGWQYSVRPSRPSSPTLEQGSHASSPSLMTSISILGGLPPYRWQEQIPNLTLSEYGRIINDDDDYNDLMAILYPQTDLYSKTITMQHLWITAQKLRREADRQRDWSKKVVYGDGRIRIATGIASTSKHTPLKNPSHQQHDCPLHTILHYPSTNITTTRSTRKPDHCWRQWWRIRQTRQQFLYSRINFLYTSFLPFTLSRMRRLNTQIFWMSTIYLQLLL